jgi:hypothetical protein
LYGVEYGLGDALSVLEHLAIPEADNLPAGPLQRLRPLGVFGGSYGMLAAVQLNHQLGLGAGEIGDVVVDRILPAKFVTTQLAVPEPSPKLALDLGLVAPQIPRPTGLELRRHAASLHLSFQEKVEKNQRSKSAIDRMEAVGG